VPSTANVPATECRSERQHHGGDQHDRRDDGAEQQGKKQEYDGQDQRDDHIPVVCRSPLHVQVNRRIAADERVSPWYRVHGGADPVNGRIRGLAVGRHLQSAVDEGVRAVDLRRGNSCDAGHAGERGSQLRGRGGVADDHNRLAHARGEVPVQHQLSDDGVRVSAIGRRPLE